MWTGGKPPSLPSVGSESPAAVTTASTASFTGLLSTPLNNGNNNNNNNKSPLAGVQAELDALRQRGLATLLNKHFTETTQKLAAEKAAADAALRDLERRKANTSDFTAQGNGELSPFDNLYLSVHQWRSECRKKERETLLLYQRYVDKFGSTGQVQVPFRQTSAAGGNGINIGNGTLGIIGRGGSPSGTAWASPLAPRHPNSSQALPPPPSSDKVPSMAAAIEACLEAHLRSGAISVPSVELLGKDETFQSSFTKEETEFRNYYRRQLELRGIDAKAQETEAQHHRGEFSHDNNDEHILQQANAFLRTIGEDMFDAGGDDEDDDDDDEAEGADGLGPLIVHNQDDLSVVSGLTFNSALTREILDDCERTVVTFLQEEQEAIRKIMETEDENNYHRHTHHHHPNSDAESMPSQVGSESMQAAEQAEHMVKQMQEILDNFRKNKDSEDNGCGDGASSNNDETISVTKEARRYETDNPSETWMVYYDEYYQREYYHELNTNRTQWEPPRSKNSTNSEDEDGNEEDNTSTTSRSSPLLSSMDVMPEKMGRMCGGSSNNGSVTGSNSKNCSRIAQYRRKRRRRRKRRLAALALIAVSALFTAVYVLYKASPEELMARTPAPLSPLVQSAAVQVKATVDYWTGETQKKQQQQLEEKEQAAKKLREQQLANEQAAKKEEAKRQKQEAAVAALKKKQLEEEERQKAKAALALAKKEEAEKNATMHMQLQQAAQKPLAALRGRVGGTIPLAYYVEDLPLLWKLGGGN